jgi:hypothetical protein
MGFNGGGFSGGGFGRATGAPSNLGAAPSAQSVGVAAYGAAWASKDCPSCNVAIVEMQSMVNTVAQRLGLNIQIATDGKVGTGTVAALHQVASTAANRGIPTAAVIMGYVNAEAVAKAADNIRDLLRQVASTLPATAPTSIPTIPSGGAPAPVTWPAASGSAPMQPTTKNKLPYLIGGGIFFVGVIAAGVILLTPKR